MWWYCSSLFSISGPLLSPFPIASGHTYPPGCPMSHSRSVCPEDDMTCPPGSSPRASPPAFCSSVGSDSLQLPKRGASVFGLLLPEFTPPFGHQGPQFSLWISRIFLPCTPHRSCLDVPPYCFVPQAVSVRSAFPHSHHHPHWAMGRKTQITVKHSTRIHFGGVSTSLSHPWLPSSCPVFSSMCCVLYLPTCAGFIVVPRAHPQLTYLVP